MADLNEFSKEALTDAEREELGEYARSLRKVESADYLFAEQTWHDERLAELGAQSANDDGDAERLALVGAFVSDRRRKRDLCQAELERRRRAGAFPSSGAFLLDYSDAKRAIRERTVELIDGYTSLQKNGREYKGLCPFHDDHRPSLRVNAEKGLWYCDPCTVGGDVFDFVMRRDQCDFPTALRELARRAGVELPQSKRDGQPATKVNDAPIEQLLEAIPANLDRVRLTRQLDPILRRLAAMPRAEATAVLWHTIKPRFGLTYKDAQGYERSLSDLRHELKEQAEVEAVKQAEREAQARREQVEKQRAELSQKLLSTQVSLVDLHGRLRDVLGDLGDLLEIVLATSAIPNIKPPVWLFVVGVPSSGKTELLRLLRASPNVYYVDTMTENAFVSGYVLPDGSEPKDLLPLLDGKCFVCKDLTTLFSLQEDTIRKLLGDLSSIYDGEFRKYTATRGDIQYTSSFAFIACITPAALNSHHRYLNIIGPRFLTYRIPPMTTDQIDSGFDALWASGERSGQLDELRDLVSAFSLQVSQRNIKTVTVDAEARRMLKRLSQLLARGRGVIIMARTKFKDSEGQEQTWAEVVESQIEEPWRGYHQIESLARALALVHRRDKVTVHDLELIRRVVLASMSPARGDALAHFADADVRGKGYVVAMDMGELTGTSVKTARNLLEELHALKILAKAKEGTQAARYSPVGEFGDLIAEPRVELDHVADYLGG